MLRLQVVDDLLSQGKAKEELEQALECADQAIAEGRSAVYDLRSSTTITNDLAEAASRNFLAPKQYKEKCDYSPFRRYK